MLCLMMGVLMLQGVISVSIRKNARRSGFKENNLFQLEEKEGKRKMGTDFYKRVLEERWKCGRVVSPHDDGCRCGVMFV